MKDGLENAFRTYTSLVQADLPRGNRSSLKDRMIYGGDESSILRSIVGQLETRDEFRQLAKETRSRFSAKDELSFDEKFWGEGVKNFFRRSGYYLDTFEGKITNSDATFAKFCHAFERQEAHVSHFALMEYVNFEGGPMDFGSFQIRGFPAKELNEIFQTQVNQVFYPYAVVDTRTLQNYWFICFNEKKSTGRFGSLDFKTDWISFDRIDIRYTRYSQNLESILQQLALFEWEKDWWGEGGTRRQGATDQDMERGWDRFYIPAVLVIDDDVLKLPPRSPSLSNLATMPIYEPHTGEIEGEMPDFTMMLDEDETNRFKGLIDEVGKTLLELKREGKDWHFLDIALGNLVKGFVAPDSIEQLLWHITVLEALLGEKGIGVTRRMAHRIGCVLGKSDDERKALQKKFEELYDFRCELVHGRRFKKEIYTGHLRQARALARQVALWFVRFLGFIDLAMRTVQTPVETPRREDILILLDMDEGDRNRLGGLLGSLPHGFPAVREWVDK